MLLNSTNEKIGMLFVSLQRTSHFLILLLLFTTSAALWICSPDIPARTVLRDRPLHIESPAGSSARSITGSAPTPSNYPAPMENRPAHRDSPGTSGCA